VRSGTVQNSWFDGNTIGPIYVGNIAGYVSSGSTVKYCYASGSASATAYNAGGIVGHNYGTVQYCYSNVNVTGGSPAGGIAGRNDGTIDSCYSTGSVTGGQSTGGIVGQSAGAAAVVKNCYATGNIYGNGNGGGNGGIVGLNQAATVQNCVALSPGIIRASGTETSYYRVIGYNSGSVLTNNYARGNMLVLGVIPTAYIGPNLANGEDFVIGSALGGVFNTTNGWDDSAVWIIPSGNLSVSGALPTLRNMPGGVQNPTLP